MFASRKISRTFSVLFVIIFILSGTPGQAVNAAKIDRAASSPLKNSVSVNSAFAGTETAAAQRDPATSLTSPIGSLKGGMAGLTDNTATLAHLAASTDGEVLHADIPPLVVMIDPNPAMQGIHAPVEPEVQAAIDATGVHSAAASLAFSFTFQPAGATDPWGKVCQTFPEQAKVAFNAAAVIWSVFIQSPVPVKISACWSDLGSPTALGYSGYLTIFNNFSGAPKANTWYAPALADALHGSDLEPAGYDDYITYNSGFSWYYGTDGKTPYGQVDLVTVAAHEIAHGLNFSGSGSYSTGTGGYGYGSGKPNIYDTFMEDSGGTKLTSYTNPSTALGSLLTSGSLWFNGSNANAGNGGTRVKIYAPTPWVQGSSYAHLDYDTYKSSINSMMVYAVAAGSSQHNPGPVTQGLMKDLGWVLDEETALHVKPAASGTGDCSSWANACALQTALAVAVSGDQIWVAAGTYVPTSGTDRSATFHLKSGVAVYGGFAGTEVTLAQRDSATNVTILSGDIGTASDSSDNSYHVVTGSGTNSTAILDGFTISHSNADGIAPYNVGGGMYNDAGSPTLSNLTFTSNYAYWGGGMYNAASSPTLTNVTFNNNYATNNGGGMQNATNSHPTLTYVTFSSNIAQESGSGMYNDASSPTLTDVTFSTNSAWNNNGGGMYNGNSSSPVLRNVTFSGNSAINGGGLYNDTSNPTLTNVTFSINTSATNAGGIYNTASNPTLTNVTLNGNTAFANGGGIYNLNSSPIIRNSLLWGDTAGSGAEIYNDTGGSSTVTYSDVQGGYTGTGNIDLDPLLGDLGTYGGNTQVFPLLSRSPAIDAGDDATCASTDQRGVSRPQGTYCDMGAFEVLHIVGTLYVIPSGATNLACDSWSSACDLQYALAAAGPTSEIWVKTGTYTPTAGTNRTLTFRLKSGVGVYGGFAGTETARSQRNPPANLTTLSGNINNWVSSDNSYNVVTGGGTNSTAVLDGFTISDGNADCGCAGGGMYNDTGSPTLANLIFSNNTAGWGGGMLNTSSSPTLTDVTFNNNTAANNGGGLENSNASSPILINVTFSNNTAAFGGGLYNKSGSNPSLTNLTFTGNSATDSGGGIYNDTGNPTLTNVTFNSNSAANFAGGIYNLNSSPIIRDSLLWGNSAGSAGEIYNDTGGSPTVTYSDVQGGYSGTGNLDLDPFLGDLGTYGGSTQVFPLLSGSPAIDAGNDATCAPKDQRGVSRPQGAHCDMGAFEVFHLVGTLYAIPGGTTSGTCSSWSSACDLQVALAAAAPASEIWVKAGTYTPTAGTNRAITFRLKSGVALYGGFAGTETARSQRDPTVNLTSLSGDIGASGDNSDNTYNVVVGISVNSTAILDGFTISGGNANCTCAGGGMYNQSSSPTLANLTFSNNSADWGGGMFNSSSSPTLTHVTFNWNSAVNTGGGMENDNSNPTLTDVTFIGNSATDGGGMINQSSSPTLTNVTFGSNSATDNGGGMGNESGSSPVLTNVTFSYNSAATLGGGMVNGGSNPTLANVTFNGNTARWGAGMYNGTSNPTLTNVTFTGNSATDSGGGMDNSSSNPTIRNSLIWGNSAPTKPQIFDENSSTPTVSYSDVQGGYSGAGNIDLDPLLGSLGYYGNMQVDPLLPGSPAIDAGDDATCASTDQRGVSRPQGAHCDMGAFEETVTGILYATPGGATSGTCSSWSTACELRYILSILSPATEIWAKAGTYTPTSGTDRSAAFQLDSNVAIYGGFAGNETARSQRDPAIHPTSLSGDIGASGDSSDNSFHVVNGNSADGTAILDGFTISGGNSNCICNGGGMYIFYGSPTLANLTFSGNAARNGAGMYLSNSSPTLTNVTFSGNNAGAGGGGMRNEINSNPSLSYVTFKDNSATWGAGIYNDSSNPTLADVTFSSNSAGNYGGGVENVSSNPTLTNVTFSGNHSYFGGGGMFNTGNSHPTIHNSVFWGNTTNVISITYYGHVINPSQIYNYYSSTSKSTITYSDVQGGCPYNDTCTNLISNDPLLGSLNTYGGATSLFPLQPGSPAIDAGDDATCSAYDQRGVSRPQGARCDMGAYEQINGRLYAIPDGVTSGNGSGTCNSWSNACELRYALSIVSPTSEVWVKAGTYKPTAGTERWVAFHLKSGIALYGGFVGTEDARDARDPYSHLTTLSGDIGAIGDSSDNSYNVVVGSGTDFTAVLDGFTISGGNADCDCAGGGMYNDTGSPTLANLSFSGNTAGWGGGMYISNGSPTLTDVTFSGNSATNNGGGMQADNSNPSLVNVTFSSNTASAGGGLFNYYSNPNLTNVTFNGNSASLYGGGIYNNTSNPVITNVTLGDNSDGNSGGGIFNTHSSPFIRDSILWNSPITDSDSGSTPTIRDSIVQDGCPTYASCTMVSTSNPLLGPLGAYGGSTQVLPLLPGSAAIDHGNNTSCASTDQREVSRPQNGICDMGAFEAHVFTLAITGGNNQNATINTAFAQPLALSVGGTNGDPVDGGLINFTAPASGASATLSSASVTVVSGAVSVNATANGTIGSYDVMADASGVVTPAIFHLTNNIPPPPDTQIDTHPANPDNSTAASFTFSSPDGTATFECSLDSGAYVACSSPKDYTGLAAGSHTFSVRAVDPPGNVDATPASYTWTIDLTTPDTQINTHPADPSNNASARFTFSSPDITATFECSMDSSAYAACSSPKDYTGLSAGAHTFSVRAKKPAGNVDATPAFYTWTIDLTAPDTQIDSHPANPSNSASAVFTFSSADGTATFECSLDSGAYAVCTSPKDYSGLAAGSHTFSVRAKDPAGNMDATPVSYTWTIDLTAPNTQIDSHPANPDNSTAASFTFSSPDGTATFECSLDSGAYAACTSPKDYTGLAAGSHTLAVRAKDPAGNMDPTPASYTWTIDLTTPDTQINTHPADPSNSTNARFTFSSPDITATFECSMDSGAYAACTSPRDYTGLSAGAHTFSVRAKNPAGKVDATPAAYTWVIDTTAPTVVSSLRVSSTPTSAISVDFTVTFSESVTGVGVSDFSLATTGVSGASVTSVSGSGSVYTVIVNTGSGNGTIHLDVSTSATITDLAGNPLAGLPYTGGETYTITKVYNIFLPLILR